MQAWEDFLLLQEKELGTETVRKWLRPLKVVSFDACNLYLDAADSFQALWFEEHMRPRLQSFVNPNQKKIRVHLSTPKTPEPPTKVVKPRKSLTPQSSNFTLAWDPLNPYCTFAHFVANASHALPLQLLYDLTQYDPAAKRSPPGITPQVSFNPIYLYGDKGTGKTHLLMATAAALLQAGVKALYVRADTFTEHVVSAIRAGEMQTFRRAYRHNDVLIIDDIEVFSRKGATQEEFFHTFNALHLEGKQILLSASCPPQELTAIEPRLVSRFEWGIVLPLQPVTEEQRKQLLLNRALFLQFPLHDKVVEFLVKTFQSSTKSLLQALEALILRTHLSQNSGRPPVMPLSLDIAKSFLGDLIKQEEQSVLTPPKILHAVAGFYGIRIDDITGKSQSHDCTLPRQIAMHLCRTQLKMPFTKIGTLFSRDHSTVITSVKQIQKSIETHEQTVSSAIHTILQELKR